MTIEELAALVIDACVAEEVEHMLTGALAYNNYGLPRSTNDVDFVVQFATEEKIAKLHQHLAPSVEFDAQVRFDTLTWGSRQIGNTREHPPLIVELFDVLDDPFAQSMFSRRVEFESIEIGRTIWIPTAEDILVQKLRWGRPKDLDDAKQLLAIQGSENLDMPKIENWCREHGSLDRLQAALEAIPPI